MPTKNASQVRAGDRIPVDIGGTQRGVFVTAAEPRFGVIAIDWEARSAGRVLVSGTHRFLPTDLMLVVSPR